MTIPTPAPPSQSKPAPKPPASWTLRREVITALLLLCFLWGEAGGIYYTYGRYGPDSGKYALFIPPYAWYRSLECAWWFTFGGYDASERKQVARFLEVVELQESAMRAEARLGGLLISDKKDIDSVIAKLRRTEQLARTVDPQVLAKLHYELPAVFETNFIAGVNEHAKALTRGSMPTRMRSAQKLAAWTIWYDEYHNKMWDKGLIDELANEAKTR